MASVSGPVWSSLPQTAQAAEHCARTAAVELLIGHSRLFGDSKNIVAHANRPTAEACHHSRMHAAASRLAAATPSAEHILEDLWVRAHRKPENEADPWEKFTAIGNGHADAAAVEAQTRLGHVDTAEWKAVAAEQAKMRTICRVIGTLAALWPSARQACGIAAKTAPPPRSAKLLTRPELPHQWVHDQGTWSCIIC